MRFKTILILVFVAIFLLFSIQNSVLTVVKILFWEFSMPLVTVIVVSFSIGILAGFLLLSSNTKQKTTKDLEEQ